MIDRERETLHDADDPFPVDPYRIGVDGRLQGYFEDKESALLAALVLKRTQPNRHVTIYDAFERRHIPVELPVK